MLASTRTQEPLSRGDGESERGGSNPSVARPPAPEAEEGDLPKMKNVVGDTYCVNGYTYIIPVTHNTFCTYKM
jgi:hypothetical protein